MARQPMTDRQLIGRIGGYRLAATHDPHGENGYTAPGRKAFLSKFEREVDPEMVLPEAERHRRADAALRAHMAGIARKSAATRRRKRAKA